MRSSPPLAGTTIKHRALQLSTGSTCTSIDALIMVHDLLLDYIFDIVVLGLFLMF
jgi:hypothetical protein